MLKKLLHFLCFTVFMGSLQSIEIVQDYKQSKKSDMCPFSFEELNIIPRFELKAPSYLTSSDGIKLAYYSFIPAKPSACVIFYPGAGLYGNKTYQWLALSLQKDYNIGCYLVDLRGHGHSEGARGDAPDEKQVWKDVDTVIEHVKSLHPTISLYLVGHSSGSGLLINYNKYGHHFDDVKGYIFLAPYLGPNSGTIREHINPQCNFVKKVRTWVYLINIFIPLNFLKHINAVFFNYPQNLLNEDPLIVDAYTYSMSSATTPYDVQSLFADLKKTFALYIGQEDEQFFPEKVIEFKNLATIVKDNSTAAIIPNAKHLSILLRAPALISEWIEKNDKESSSRSEVMAIFFNYAKEQLQQIPHEIEKLKKEGPKEEAKFDSVIKKLKDNGTSISSVPNTAMKIKLLEEELNTYKIAELIADKNINALKQVNSKELQKNDLQIWVEADRFPNNFKNSFEGKLASMIIGGENALAFVLFHSATNKTEEDNKKTLEMLRVLLEDKKLNPNAIVGIVYWVKDNPTDTRALDYVSNFPLVALAIDYSFPAALELLLKHGATFSSNIAAGVKERQNELPNAKRIQELFANYKSQEVK